MADPTAQFPVVSSSSFPSSPSSGRPQPGGCHGGSVSCADPPISSSSSSSSSSSQPVSLFAASPAAPALPTRGAFPGGGPAQSPPESPESPFEVVPDRAAFDREFGPALGQIPEGRECHFVPKARGALGGPGALGGTPSPGRGLGRPPPGSAAALEEVSRCVREMHNFTSELLTWDLVERNGHPGHGDSAGDTPGDTPGDGDTGNGHTGTGNGDTGNGHTGTGNGDIGTGNGGTGAGNGDIGTGNGGIGTGKGGTRTGSGGSGTGSGSGGTGSGSGGTGSGGIGVGNGGIGTNGVLGIGNGVLGAGSGTSGTGNGVLGTGNGGTGGIGSGGTGGIGSGIPGTGSGIPGVPPDADSSGDSDSTVVEEGPGEAPPDVPKGHHGPDVPKGHHGPEGPGHCQQEPLTLRALGQPRLAVLELLFWRDVRRSAVAFGASLVLLLSLATLSAVTVVAHVALALLSVTISLRVYRAVVQALQKAEEGHPFRAYLDADVTLSPERFRAGAAALAQQVNRGLRLLIRLFLVEDLVDSLELALAMWLLTYVGAVFNGITLLILGDLLAFTLPPLYEKYKVQIDHYVGIARRQTKDLLAKVQAKLPGLAKKKPE